MFEESSVTTGARNDIITSCVTTGAYRLD